MFLLAAVWGHACLCIRTIIQNLESLVYLHNPELYSYHRLCLTFITYCTGTMWHIPLPATVGPFTRYLYPFQRFWSKDCQVLALYRPTHLEIYDCTCLESPPFPHTMGAAHCRHNVVVGGVPSKSLRECDGCHSTEGEGRVPVDQVDVGWVCTIVNGASILWLKCALHKGIGWISCVNMDSKNFGATCEGRG